MSIAFESAETSKLAPDFGRRSQASALETVNLHAQPATGMKTEQWTKPVEHLQSTLRDVLELVESSDGDTEGLADWVREEFSFKPCVLFFLIDNHFVLNSIFWAALVCSMARQTARKPNVPESQSMTSKKFLYWLSVLQEYSANKLKWRRGKCKQLRCDMGSPPFRMTCCWWFLCMRQDPTE